MADVVIYTKPFCPYCDRAKALLERKEAGFTEIVAAGDAEKKAEMVARSGGRATFPQIFIDNRHIGGCDDLHALDAQGGLDPLLARA
jgi:glutaredoxin 3